VATSPLNKNRIPAASNALYMACRLFAIGVRVPVSKSRTVESPTLARFASSGCGHPSQARAARQGRLSGVVEIDGAYVGGAIRQENEAADRPNLKNVDRPGRQSVVIARQRDGPTLPVVVAKESDAVPFIRQHVAPDTTVHANEAPGWDRLHAYYAMMRINHSVAFSKDGACTNWAESFFSRMRRAEWGQHRHISGKYLLAYAREMAWREDTRRQPNGSLHEMMTSAALAHPVSRTWAGYWQRAS
jgi:hypothetical protein